MCGKRTVRAKPAQSGPIDLAIEVGSEPDRTVTLAVEIERSIDPRSVPAAAMQIKALTGRTLPQATPVVAAAYMSPRSRQLFEDFDVGYIDTTGNIRIDAGNLFVQTQGADKDPWPQDDTLQTLRGRGAARAVRAVIDTAPPLGVREIASKGLVVNKLDI